MRTILGERRKSTGRVYRRGGSSGRRRTGRRGPGGLWCAGHGRSSGIGTTPEGYLAIYDRDKDVVKSGGEWISSIALEGAAAGHRAVDASAGPGTAAIAVPHPKWGERPLLFVRLRSKRPRQQRMQQREDAVAAAGGNGGLVVASDVLGGGHGDDGGYDHAALRREFDALLLASGIAKFWLPDRYVFLDAPLPLQGTGKVWKLRLRERYANGEFGFGDGE